MSDTVVSREWFLANTRMVNFFEIVGRLISGLKGHKVAKKLEESIHCHSNAVPFLVYGNTNAGQLTDFNMGYYSHSTRRKRKLRQAHVSSASVVADLVSGMATVLDCYLIQPRWFLADTCRPSDVSTNY